MSRNKIVFEVVDKHSGNIIETIDVTGQNQKHINRMEEYLTRNILLLNIL